ncbi:YadA C-terminal domain-containing protein [Megasphaera stantonii]|nr:S-layer homology domain-containing protein [Megasphaera stantonii]HJE82835.1 S-layer homology domain-containing protein [Megasphaera stantonii]
MHSDVAVGGNHYVAGSQEVLGNGIYHGSVAVGKDVMVGGSVVANGNVSGNNLYAANDVFIGGQSLSSRFGSLDSRISKVGAGAAALAGLHPLDYDPLNKWDFAAGYGHYSGADAVAIGAYYRPNENTMFSLAGTVGSDEDMLNAGLSIKFGPGTAGKSRAELTKQVAEMQEQNAKLAQEVQTMKQALYALVGMVDMTKVKEMPDVPQDHWAKDAVDHLAGNGVIEGYPDGTFKGDKTMTRYEIAEMLYKALQKGAQVDPQMLKEYAPELEALQGQHK